MINSTLDTPSTDIEILNQKDLPLSSLLPYDPAVKVGPRLKDGIKEYLFLLTATEKALEAADKGELKNFDPLVGENACQIRALKLALIITKYPFDIQKLLNEVLTAKSYIENILLNIQTYIKSGRSLADLLESSNIQIILNYNQLFIIKAYLLTKVKIEEPFDTECPLTKIEYTDVLKIKEISEIGSNFAKEFIKGLRQKLSANSVRFVKDLANSLKSDFDKYILSEKFLIKHRGLECLPCFWSTRVLLDKAINDKIPVVMLADQKAKDKNYEIVEKSAIFFESTENGYKRTTSTSFNPEQPALILVGTTYRNLNEFPENKENWVDELSQHCPRDLLLAYSAVHRQYPNIEQEHILSETEDKDLEFYKRKAEEWGCCKLNPSLFFFTHVYCEKVKNISFS